MLAVGELTSLLFSGRDSCRHGHYGHCHLLLLLIVQYWLEQDRPAVSADFCFALREINVISLEVDWAVQLKGIAGEQSSVQLL